MGLKGEAAAISLGKKYNFLHFLCSQVRVTSTLPQEASLATETSRKKLQLVKMQKTIDHGVHDTSTI